MIGMRIKAILFIDDLCSGTTLASEGGAAEDAEEGIGTPNIFV